MIYTDVEAFLNVARGIADAENRIVELWHGYDDNGRYWTLDERISLPNHCHAGHVKPSPNETIRDMRQKAIKQA